MTLITLIKQQKNTISDIKLSNQRNETLENIPCFSSCDLMLIGWNQMCESMPWESRSL